MAASITRSAEHSGQTTRKLLVSAIGPILLLLPVRNRALPVHFAPVIATATRILRQRQLLAVMTARELKARYRGSVLGFLWSLANPLLLLGVYTFVFGLVFQPRAAGQSPYPVFLVCGLFPWIWVSSSLNEATASLTANAGADPPLGLPGRAPADGGGAVEPGPLPARAADPRRRAARGARCSAIRWAALDRPAAAGGGAPPAVSVPAWRSAWRRSPSTSRTCATCSRTCSRWRSSSPRSSTRSTPCRSAACARWSSGTRRRRSRSPTRTCCSPAARPSRMVWLEMAVAAAVAWSLGAWLFDRLRDTLVEAV